MVALQQPLPPEPLPFFGVFFAYTSFTGWLPLWNVYFTFTLLHNS